MTDETPNRFDEVLACLTHSLTDDQLDIVEDALNIASAAMNAPVQGNLPEGLTVDELVRAVDGLSRAKYWEEWPANPYAKTIKACRAIAAWMEG